MCGGECILAGKGLTCNRNVQELMNPKRSRFFSVYFEIEQKME